MIEHDPARPELGNATYLSILAYPSPDEAEAGESFRKSLLACFYRQRAADPGWKWSVQRIEPGYLLIDPRVAERAAENGLRRISTSRLPSAEIAISIFANAIHGDTLKMKIKGGGLFEIKLLEMPASVNAGADMASDRLNREHNTQKTRSDFIKRSWTPTKPVIHLACGLRDALMDYHVELAAIDLVGEAKWLERAVAAANTTMSFFTMKSDALSTLPLDDLSPVELKRTDDRPS